MHEPVVTCENISKKFCRDLRRSLWYGAKDIVGELTFTRDSKEKLRREEFWSLRDISFELAEGETLGLVGHNGAGKSTLLKLLNGIYYPDMGRIGIRGQIGALIELGAGFNPTLTGRENIYINAAVLGLQKKEIDQRFDEILEFAEIGDFIDSPVRNYSSGMKVRLGFSVATHLEPDILLIDEILAVGDSSFRERCYQRLTAHKRNGGSVIFVSHNSLAVEAISDRVIVLKDGLLVENGAPSETLLKYEQGMQNISTSATSKVDQSQDLEARVAEDQFRDIEIVSAEFLDVAGNKKSEFAYNEPFKIQVSYESREGTSDAYFIFAIHKRSGQEPPITSMSMPWDDTSLQRVPSSGNVTCEIHNPTLTPGTYILKVSIQATPHAGLTSVGKKWHVRPKDIGKFTIGYDGLKDKFPGIPAAHAISGMPPVMIDHSWVISE